MEREKGIQGMSSISTVKAGSAAWMNSYRGHPDTKLQNGTGSPSSQGTGRVGKSLSKRRQGFTGKLTLWWRAGHSQRDGRNGRGRFMHTWFFFSTHSQSEHCPSRPEEEGVRPCRQEAEESYQWILIRVQGNTRSQE